MKSSTRFPNELKLAEVTIEESFNSVHQNKEKLEGNFLLH
jgi:hypothetical protein